MAYHSQPLERERGQEDQQSRPLQQIQERSARPPSHLESGPCIESSGYSACPTNARTSHSTCSNTTRRTLLERRYQGCITASSRHASCASSKVWHIILVVVIAQMKESNAASVTSLGPSNGPSIGGSDIYLLGKELGPTDLGPKARVSGTACSRTTWVSASAIICRMDVLDGGIGINKAIGLTILQYLGVDVKSFVLEVTPLFTFDSLGVSLSSPVNGPTTAYTSPVVIIGTGFSPVDYSIMARLGKTACEASQWVSESAVKCKNGPSVKQLLSLGITLGRSEVTTSDAFSYDRPHLEVVGPVNSGAKGGDRMTIFGKGFGALDPTQDARLHMGAGELACLSTAWSSDSTVVCVLPAGVDVGVSVAVTTNRNVDTVFTVFSYDACIITGLQPTNLPSTGALFTITGMNFGNKEEMGKRNVRLGDSACHGPTWTSDSVLTCNSAPGLGQRLISAVTVAGDTNRLSNSISYDHPIVRSLFRTNAPASGNVVLILSGQSFGAFEHTPLATIGVTTCSYTKWINDERVECLMPRTTWSSRFFAGSPQHLKVAAQNYVAVNENAITYDEACLGPCVGSLLCDARQGASHTPATGCQGPTGGDWRHDLNIKRVEFDEFEEESVVRIHGNFSVSGSHVLVGNSTHNASVPVKERVYAGDVTVTFGELYDCQVLQPAAGDDTSLQQYIDCLLPPGVGRHHKIQVTIKNASYTALLDGCTDSMKEYGTEKYLGQPFGNCLQPTPGTDFVTAVDQGLTYSYSRPEITAITPTRGVNMANSSFDITIYGTNMGGTARELQRDKCLLPAYANLRACKLLMTNGVIIFNTSCQDIDLLTNASAPAQIEQEIAARQLAACRDSKQITFKCQHAFTAKYTMCVERCRFAFRKCGRRCAEDALSCQVLPFGGNQVLTIVLGGTTSGSFNLTYEVPRVWYIIPPELSASLLRPASSLAVQEPKLLTIIGRNFGVDLALAYAGRRQIAPIGPYDWNLPNLLYDNTQIPLYAPSIEWWDMAQYRTCFSVAPDATEGDAAASASTPVSSHTRQCDAGVVLSEMTNLADVERSFLGEDSPRYLQRMIVKAPVVALSSDEVSIEINALVESLGQRSYAMPAVNSTILFRQSCSDFAPHMGRHTLPFFQATKKLRGIVSRSEVQVVSWAAKEAIVMIGGSTLDQLHTRKIFVSGFSGLNAWVEIQYNDAVPWFSARSNQTVVIYKDVLAVIAGWSTGPVPPGSQVATKIFYNDVWIYADSEGVANIYKSDKSPEPQLALGQDFVPYWILVALNAPFRPRSSMTAVEFKGRLFLMGGDGPDSLGVIAPIADLWVTNDLKVWTILQDLTSWDLTTPLWQGRNSLFALVHDEKLYVVARVQNSFYNTFYSENGNDWLPVPGACALSHIEVQAAVVYRSRMLLFTVGCHSYDIPAGARRYEKAIDCSVEQDGPFQRENRIYYSSDGVTWRLSQRPFRLSQFLEPEFMQHHWSGKRSGEYRVGYKVLVHHDSLYLIGGQQKITFVDKFDNPILDKDGKVQKQDLDAMDMWLSKGLVDLLLLCVQNSDLTTQGIIDAMQAATSPECEFGFSKLPGGVLQDAILPR